MVRSSMPLYTRHVKDQEPAGLLAQKFDNAGPSTGNRMRPSPVDAEGPLRPRMYAPEKKEDLLKEVASRKGGC